MTRAAVSPPTTRTTVADLLRSLGDIPADRVRLVPTPGTATERDVIAVHDRENRLCELVDGILVEKAMGYHEGRLAAFLIVHLGGFVLRHNLNVINGPDGVQKLVTGLVRIPDVSFVSWDRLPGRKVPAKPVPSLPLDPAVLPSFAALVKLNGAQSNKPGIRMVGDRPHPWPCKPCRAPGYTGDGQLALTMSDPDSYHESFGTSRSSGPGAGSRRRVR